MDTSSGEILDAYIARIDQFVEQLLRGYLERLKTSPDHSVSAKEVNDPVWGTIALSPLEVVVLDSPLLQRLRRVRQLGVAQYVYPGANHTRLEHSIGVCHQVQRLITSLQLHAKDVSIPERWVESLRLGALCHDVGHGLMSHVVENALRFDDACIDLALQFQDFVDKETESQLSEIAAYFMLRSPAFAELIASARRIAGLGPDSDMATRMSELVIGSSKDDEFPLIHEVISGPFDCDKLDYMTRDAMMCGVPVVTDVTRLIQKIRAVRVRTDRLPRDLQDLVEDRGDAHTIVAVARSGASTLHEVSLARSLMHDKVYRHHKVRATEVMVAAVLAKVGHVLDPNPAMIPLAIVDDELLALDTASLDARHAQTGGDLGDDERSVALDLCERLRDRRLFVRAFAFSQKMPFDPYRKDAAHRAAIEGLIREADEGRPRLEIIKKIADRVRSMLASAPPSTPLPASIALDLAGYLWIDPPVVKRKNEHDSDQNRAYLVDHGNELVQMADVSAETRGWADAYINTRDVGYVFCPVEIASYVHLATEVVLRVEHDIVVPREMHSYAKVEPGDVQRLRQELQREGYYRDLPRDLRPIPEFLTKAGTKTRLEGCAARLAQYMGPSPQRDEGKADAGALSAARILHWIMQFDDDDVALALKLIENTMLLDREATVRALEVFLRDPDNADFASASLVPLGAPKDGSSVLTYYAGDLSRDHSVTVRSLTAAVARNEPVIFVDDIIQRGSSSISILEAQLGLPDSQDLDEERDEPLGEAAQEALRSRPIAIVTAAAKSDGIATAESTLKDYGLDVRVFANVVDAAIPNVHSALAGEPPERVAAFITRLEKVGLALMNQKRRPQEKMFGYGNEGLLVISAFNTPTMTLTALWAGGEVDGVVWRPLFPRRDKH